MDIKLKLLNIDEICKELPEITSYKIIESRKFSPSGLFSLQLFGPIKSYHCACSKLSYKGPSYSKERCPKCNVEIISCNSRKERYAKIKLPFKLLNPIFFQMLVGNRHNMKKILNSVLSYREKYIITENGDIEKIKDGEEIPEKSTMLQGLDGAIKIMEFICDKNEDKVECKFAKDNKDCWTIENVLVIPPEFRPCGKIDKNEEYIADDINKYYNKIIKITNGIKDMPFALEENQDLYRSNFRYLQMLVFSIYDYVLERMSKKSGLIRTNILGKRVDFSGRAVISPNPKLNLDECGIPYWMVLEILKPQLIAHIINKRICKKYNDACKIIEDCIKDRDPSLFDLVEEFCNEQICVLNRQPTLHRMSVLAFKVRIHLGDTIQIHPMVCSPFNADFDGDAMALYFPVTETAFADVKSKIGIWNNLISPTDIELVPQPNQDIILGIYTATKDDSADTEFIEFKDKKISKGVYEFNKCLPDNYPLIDIPIDKKKLRAILNHIGLNYPKSVVIRVIDNIKELGFKYSTKRGYTLALKNLYSERLKKIAETELTGTVQEDMKFIGSNYDIKELMETSDYADFIKSGARGDWAQASQLVFSRGYVADANNKIRGELIRSSLVSGLNPKEFFNSCWGSRKGLLDTAVSTGDTGYLTRQLIYSTCSTELGEIEDCGTKDGLVLLVKDSKMAKSILWRNYIDQDGNIKRVTNENYHDLIGKTIQLRSPIFCRNRKICKTCYGNLYKILHSDQIGIVATQAIGERITQLVLRTFHLSGVAQGGDSEQNEDIISGMSLAKKLFHSPDCESPEELVYKLYNVFSEYGSLHLIHYEIITSSMMWVENKRWRLIENRKEEAPEFVSILEAPTRNSWLLAVAFSNIKRKLIYGLVSDGKDESSSITQLFRF